MAVAGQHQIVVEGGLGQCGNRLADIIAVVGADCTANCRIAPVVHHLGHRCSHTAHNAVLTLIDGTLPVIGLFLAPIGLDKGGNTASGMNGRRDLVLGMGLEVFDLLLITFHQGNVALGQVVVVQLALVTVA